MAKIGAHLSYANVVSSLALFLVLAGGTALALSRNSVSSQHIGNGQVKSVDLGNGQVKSIDLQNRGVRGVDVLDNGLSGVDIDESSLQVPKAENATTAENAANAQNATFATELQFFGRAVWHNATSEDFGQLAAHTCVDAPPVEADSRPGDHVIGTVNGGNAPNPLPAGVLATVMLESGNVLLRLCNATDSEVPAFNLNWQFAVLRDTSPD
jgi:hypothetical protein